MFTDDLEFYATLDLSQRDDRVMREFAMRIGQIIEDFALNRAISLTPTVMQSGEVPDSFWIGFLSNYEKKVVGKDRKRIPVLEREYPLTFANLKAIFDYKISQMFTDYTYVLAKNVTKAKGYYLEVGEMFRQRFETTPKTLYGNFTIQDLVDMVEAEYGLCPHNMVPSYHTNGMGGSAVVEMTVSYL